jgi:hypothetical protein
MAAPFSDFLKFIGTDFEGYILPIIPAGAKLKEESRITPGHLGKIPGLWLAEERVWVGFKDWQTHHAYANASSLKHYERWQSENGVAIAVGMNTNVFNVVDIDSDNPEIADSIERWAVTCLGFTPVVRLRHASVRRVLVYERDQHTAPTLKRRLKFKDAHGAEHAVEFLARGQQVVIEGPHAKGQMHYWREGGLLENREALRAGLITGDMAESFFRALGQWIEETDGLEMLKSALPSRGSRGVAVKVDSTGTLAASDKDMLSNAINAIDINDPSLDDYDTWCLLFRAMWAACGGDRAFYAEHILPWLLKNPENKEEEMEAKLASFRDSMHGADFVYEWAARFGFTEGTLAIAQELFKGLARPVDPALGLQDRSAPLLPGEGSISLAASEQSRRHGAPLPKLIPPDFDPCKLPRRPFVLGHRFMAGTVSLGVAPPGTGKSNFSILTALSIATGQALTGEPVHHMGPVWIHNNEDSLDELYRRVSGVLKFHGIKLDDVRENIFLSSGLDDRLVVALKERDTVQRTKAVINVITSISENKIVHMVIDPLVSTHRGVSENSNEEIEQVAETIRHIAYETGCSIDLVHHAIKSHTGNSESHAGDMNAARGASALIGAVRIMYTLSPMSRKTAKDLNIPHQVSARLMRLDQGKGNYSARDPSIQWFELVTVPIGNGVDVGSGFILDGDTVAVPVPWTPAVVVGESVDDDARIGDPKETERQRVRDFLAKSMQADRAELCSLIGQVQRQFSIGKTAARNRVMKAVGDGRGALAQANGVSYRLTIEREEPAPPGRLFVIRTGVGAHDEDSAHGEITAVAVNKAAVSERACHRPESEAYSTELDAPADLVPA